MARVSSSEVSFVFQIWQSYFDASIVAAVQLSELSDKSYIDRVEARAPAMEPEWVQEMQLNVQEKIDLSKAQLEAAAEDWLPDAN
jgi:hypothetical protein